MKTQKVLTIVLPICCVGALLLIAAALLREEIPRRLYDHHLSQQTMETHRINEPADLQINLTDPGSNDGKVLYQDGGCQIYVEGVLRVDTPSGHFYNLQLVCRPEITWNGVHLVVPHGENVQEPPLVTNQGETYWSSLSGKGPQGYDGWHVSYYLFLQDPEQQSSSENPPPPEPDSVTLQFGALEDCRWQGGS